MSPETDRRTFLAHSAGALAAMALVPDLSLLAREPLAPHTTALVGVGPWGRKILGELKKIDGLTVGAIADVDPPRLGGGGKRVPEAKQYDSITALLEGSPEVESVIVATPTHLHRAVVEEALAGGKHVYCEAPLAHTIEDARGIVAAAASARESGGRVVAAGLTARANPVYDHAREFFRSDAVRKLLSMRSISMKKTSWRIPSPDPSRAAARNWRLDPELSLGLPGEWGTHAFDTVHWYTDELPLTVSGGGRVLAWPDGRTVADTVDLTLRYPSGAALQFEASLGSSYESSFEVFHGLNASIRLARTHAWMFKEADAPTQGWEVYATRERIHRDEGIILIANATQLASQGKLKDGIGLPNDPLHYALADFFQGIGEGKEVATSIEEGYRATVMGVLAQRAVTTGETISFDAAHWDHGATTQQ